MITVPIELKRYLWDSRYLETVYYELGLYAMTFPLLQSSFTKNYNSFVSYSMRRGHQKGKLTLLSNRDVAFWHTLSSKRIQIPTRFAYVWIFDFSRMVTVLFRDELEFYYSDLLTDCYINHLKLPFSKSGTCQITLTENNYVKFIP